MLSIVSKTKEDDEDGSWDGAATDLLKMIGGREEAMRNKIRDTSILDKIRKKVAGEEMERARSNKELLRIKYLQKKTCEQIK